MDVFFIAEISLNNSVEASLSAPSPLISYYTTCSFLWNLGATNVLEEAHKSARSQSGV